MTDVYVTVQAEYDGDPCDAQLVGPFPDDDAAYAWCEKFEKTSVNTNYHNATLSVVLAETPETFAETFLRKTKREDRDSATRGRIGKV